MKNRKINLIYLGSPSFSAVFLKKLLTDISINQIVKIKFVITQPDRPVGRKQILAPTPVKQIAQEYQIPVFYLKFPLSNFQYFKADLAIVFAYGQIIPKELIGLLKYGFWNIHPSLLPKYRGPSPIAYPLIFGDKKTGVTIFQMDEKIDHGPIISQEEISILPNDRRPDLEIKLTNLAFSMFKKIIFQLTRSGVVKSQSKKIRKPIKPLTLKLQDDQYATYTRLLKKSDGFIPLPALKKALNNEPIIFEDLPEIIKEYLTKYLKEKEIFFKKTFNFSLLTFNLFRGLYPWPGLWTQIRPTRSETGGYKRLKITDLSLINNKLIIKKVHLEGKKEMEFITFNQSYNIV